MGLIAIKTKPSQHHDEVYPPLNSNTAQDFDRADAKGDRCEFLVPHQLINEAVDLPESDMPLHPPMSVFAEQRKLKN